MELKHPVDLCHMGSGSLVTIFDGNGDRVAKRIKGLASSLIRSENEGFLERSVRGL